MGYTHYYTLRSPRADLKVLEIAADVKSIIMASEIQIGDWNGEPGSEPKLGPDEINFNAMQPDDFTRISDTRLRLSRTTEIRALKRGSASARQTGCRTTRWCAPR